MCRQKILLLATDAFGGRGGIAKFNRDLIRALALQESVIKVVVVPRVGNDTAVDIPDKVVFVREAANGKGNFIKALFSILRKEEAFDLVVCGHINLVPLAYLAKTLLQTKLLLIVHGIEAWTPTRHWLRNFTAKRVDMFVSVSHLTKQRFMSWTGITDSRAAVVPNTFDPGLFTPGPKKRELLKRYRLEGKVVLMTCGRLAASERYKGFDEILEALTELAIAVPDIVYLIVGDGDDQPRLENKAKALNIADRVVFAGFVSEAEKVDHYRLADVFVMAGRGEGFGIVYLEAMACGIPTVGSKLDGSAEALRGGSLGLLVNPDDRFDIKRGIIEALSRTKQVPEGLDYFSFENYAARVRDVLRRLTAEQCCP